MASAHADLLYQDLDNLLQINPGADALSIKRKYRELAVALHPDKCKVIDIVQIMACCCYSCLTRLILAFVDWHVVNNC